MSPYEPGKVVRSISQCLGHRSNNAYEAYWLSRTVEDSLISNFKPALSKNDLNLIIVQVLKNFDEVAALQYIAKHGMTQPKTSRRKARF